MQCAIEFEIKEILRLKKFQKQRFLSHLGANMGSITMQNELFWRIEEKKTKWIHQFRFFFPKSEICYRARCRKKRKRQARAAPAPPAAPAQGQAAQDPPAQDR